MQAVPSNAETSSRIRQVFIDECENNKKQFQNCVDSYKKNIEEYTSITKRLQDSVKKLEIPTEAPICDVAFFCDAHIVKTNEVLVDIGDGYFAECSSYTAMKVIKKRVNEFQKAVEDGMASIKLIDEKLNYTNSLFNEEEKDVVEIREPYDENAEKTFYEKRRENINPNNEKTPEDDLAHKSAMLRLEELERLEAENGEMGVVPKDVSEEEDNDDEESSDGDELTEDSLQKLLKMPGVSEKDVNRILQYLEACEQTSSEEEDEEEEEEEQNAEDLDSDDYDENVKVEQSETFSEEKPKVVEVPQNLEIKKTKKKGVQFSQKLEKVKTFDKDEALNSSSTDSSPEIETKSILKNKDPTPVHPDALKDHKEISQMSTNSFPGMIVEKNSIKFVDCEPSTSKGPPPAEVQQQKKMSRFRQRRSAGNH